MLWAWLLVTAVTSSNSRWLENLLEAGSEGHDDREEWNARIVERRSERRRRLLHLLLRAGTEKQKGKKLGSRSSSATVEQLAALLNAEWWMLLQHCAQTEMERGWVNLFAFNFLVQMWRRTFQKGKRGDVFHYRNVSIMHELRTTRGILLNK